jgi:hypothetical protein
VTPPEESDGPIEAYLDQLVAGLSGRRPRDLRYLLAETEAHLRDETERGVAAGLPPLQAEAQAVQRMGPVADLVTAEKKRQATSGTAVVREFLTTGLLLGGIGAVAVGISGVLAAGVQLIWGGRVLVDVAPGQTLAAADCVRWLAADPAAPTCRDAAVADWVWEVIGYRIVLGVLGAIALAGYGLLRRNWTRRNAWAILPVSVSDTIAVVLFGIATAWTLALGVDAIVVNAGHGAGQWLSATPVALAAAAVFAVRLVRDLREHPAVP